MSNLVSDKLKHKHGDGPCHCPMSSPFFVFEQSSLSPLKFFHTYPLTVSLPRCRIFLSRTGIHTHTPEDSVGKIQHILHNPIGNPHHSMYSTSAYSCKRQKKQKKKQAWSLTDPLFLVFLLMLLVHPCATVAKPPQEQIYREQYLKSTTTTTTTMNCSIGNHLTTRRARTSPYCPYSPLPLF